MSDPRERVLASVRRSLRRTGPLEASVRDGLEMRLAAHARHVMPQVGRDVVARFVEKARAAAATLERVPSVSEVSAALLRFIEAEELPPAIVTGSDPLLAEVRWSNELSVAARRPADADRIGVVSAFAGIAETGTVVLLSDPLSPTTLNFLPEYHVVLLERERIVAHIEDAWERLREERPAMPRTVNLITGPSRTADVELNLEFGAHGPRRLHVLLLDPA